MFTAINAQASNAEKWNRIKSVPTPAIVTNEQGNRVMNVVQIMAQGNFKYIPDSIDTWKTPKEFVKDGGGDCEDFAIWEAFKLMEYGYKRKDISMLIGYDFNDDVHAIILIDGMIIEPRALMPMTEREYRHLWRFEEAEIYQF